MTNKKVVKVLSILGIILCFYFGVKFLSELRSYNMMGSGGANSITLSGHGEVKAVPDIATISLSIRKDAKTVKEAQEAVAVVEKKVLEFLGSKDIGNKDIKTENASFNPKYEYRYDYKMMYPCSGYNCPPGKNIIVGYEAYENLSIKVRNTDIAGEVIQGLGSLGVEQLNGPNFTIDNEDELKAQARKEAIDDAKAKAKVLAKDLGVKLVRIVDFNEGGNYYPMYDNMMLKAEGANAGSGVTPTAELPKGENTISSDITITFEIR